MSFWYDIKHKNYASDVKGSWIRAYVDNMLANISNDTELKLNSHYLGSSKRHTADSIDCNDGNTVQASLDNETSARLSADSAIRQEFTALDTAAKEKLNTEVQERKDADSLLSARIDAESSERATALSTKVDKVDGMTLSSNDYTDAEKSKLNSIESGAQVNSVTSVSGRTGAVELAKTDVGLSNVDNTADTDKPVSSATQAALDDKVGYDEFEEQLSLKADTSSVLTKSNTAAFTPTSNYQPATKKYVDDNISAAGGGDMMKSVYDSDGDGMVDKAMSSEFATLADDASALGGLGAEYYALKIDVGNAVSSLLATPPTLTAVSPDGTAIGSDGWTGTGFFCTAANTKYAMSMGAATLPYDIAGYNRFCLKPVTDTEEWWNWTPYYTTDGITYEFFYSPSRGVYETLIPPTDVAAATIVESITWVRKPPIKLLYGKVSNLIGYYHQDATDTSEEVNTYYLKKFNIDSMRCVTGNDYPGTEDIDAITGFLGFYVNDELSALSVTECIYLLLLTDGVGSGTMNTQQAGAILLMTQGEQSFYKILTIDNGFPGA